MHGQGTGPGRSEHVGTGPHGVQAWVCGRPPLSLDAIPGVRGVLMGAGTPTPSTGTGSGAAHLQPLLSFLRQQPYGGSKAAWDTSVQRPLEARVPWGRRQLMALLRRCMIR